jgi:hypothetical protein
MTTYKEVFQLAQDKGYNPIKKTPFTLRCCIDWMDIEVSAGRINADHLPKAHDTAKLILEEKEELRLLELTLIQKWLRDEHRINIIVRYSPQIAQQWFTTIISECYSNKPKLKDIWNFTTYEQALLEGINEALKLI